MEPADDIGPDPVIRGDPVGDAEEPQIETERATHELYQEEDAAHRKRSDVHP
jgi:hypothetical protein